MSMSPPEIGIKDLLVSGSIGTFAATTGWSIHLGGLPTEPDTAIACVPTGGLAPSPLWLLNQPSVQVLVRGATNGYSAASNKAQDVVACLLGIDSQSVNGDFWGGITQIGEIAFLGFDEKKRPLFSCNFSIIVEPKAGGHRLPMT